MSKNNTEILNENVVENVNSGRGRKLTAKDSTFTLDNGTYRGTITDAFWYKTAEKRERVMLVFELDDGIVFKNSVDGDWIENYPFSVLISQANIEYVEDFKGHKVKFEVRNNVVNESTFTNIKRISLDE